MTLTNLVVKYNIQLHNLFVLLRLLKGQYKEILMILAQHEQHNKCVCCTVS